ncbi:fatty acid amide hydrolase-like [Stylophora pistillata]|uniref:fatty acid amide hydrolase-like n=1 Tax=Stylophora pistillata TaxID=50429 RepID=UPI000C04AA5D|nr:fatty acid amide hydrolase-like [Stylophora pistillata]
MLTILSGVLGLLFLLWIFSDSLWPAPPAFVERQLGKPDLPIEYNLVHDAKNIPRLAGKQLLFSKWLGKTSLGNVLKQFAFRKAGLDLLIRIKIPDAPTLFPLPEPHQHRKSYEPVDFDKLIEERKAGLDLLIRIKIPDAPTLFPLPEPHQHRKSYEPVDFDKLIEESIEEPKESSFKFVTILDLTKEYRSHTVTPMQIAQRVIEIINDTEKQNPKLRAIVQHDEDEILKMAAESTKRYAEGNPLSFMDGIPVATKEEYLVVPYYTRCGTTFMGRTRSTEDAHIVKKLRMGGAIIIGITNMHEVGIGTTGNNPNRLHGIPRNPYNVNHYTGGSSSGSAVAVAAGLCPVSLGTDGGGSIRIPAAACGVVGIKASCGRISTSGEVPLAHTVSYTGKLWYS